MRTFRPRAIIQSDFRVSRPIKQRGSKAGEELSNRRRWINFDQRFVKSNRIAHLLEPSPDRQLGACACFRRSFYISAKSSSAALVSRLSQVWRARSSQPLGKPKCPNRKKREKENPSAREES
jgi:hypothetical protein